MYKITLIHIGKSKKGPHKELCEEYLKRLSPYMRIDEVQITEERFHEKSDRERVLLPESEKIKKAIPSESFVIVLDADGNTYTSEDFSKKLAFWSDQQTQHLVFILGGPLGLHDSIKKRANTLLSFSPMTFPHDLARVMLLEQLYRTSTIQAGKTYHY
jgi:23S rRNA (pseudouridine1915-N3)-methyltransferase